jgi:hypothetical protein
VTDTPAAHEHAGFDPSGARALAVSDRMRARLGDSLRYIADSAAGQLRLPPGLPAFLGRLAAGPVSPLVFGAYCDLVLALHGDALEQAEALFQEIAAAPNLDPGPTIRCLDDPLTDPASERYRRLVDTDPEMPFTIAPPTVDVAARCRTLIAQAFALIDAGNPELAAEIRTIVQEIVLAAGPGGLAAVQFDGVSAFLLWGGVVLNASSYATPIEMVQALAHESGHNLLFGLCADGPLQGNDDAERFSSPLRPDPRPMDGVVHAAYVTARMHQAVQRLLDAGVLGPGETAEAAAAARDHVRRFATGMEIVDRHARLTPLGETVMDGARRYMAAWS